MSSQGVIYFQGHEDQKKWDRRFMEMAELVATWSKDPSTKVGAVLVNPDKTIAGVGYNGFPRGVTDEPALYEDRSEKYARVIHAEVNAIHNAQSTRGATLYCTLFPCSGCAAQTIQAGVSRVVTPPPVDRPESRYDVSLDMFRKAGVEVVYYNEQTA